MNKALPAALVLALSATYPAGARADDPPPNPGQPEPASTSTNWQAVGGVASLIAGAGFVGLFTISTLQIHNVDQSAEFEMYRQAHPGAEDVCELPDGEGRLRDLCSKADTYEALQWVSVPAALVAIGVGVVLIIRSGRDETPAKSRRVDVTAGVGPQGGQVGLVGRF